MNILVTGGAGYVGSHIARRLGRDGHSVWIFDSFVRGHWAATLGTPSIQGELSDQPRLTAVLRKYRIDAVVHCAGLTLVGESVEDPGRYYDVNVVGTLRLLNAMLAAGVERIVFSSTTAVFGAPTRLPIHDETQPCPLSPYGFSKLVVERMLDDFAAAYGIKFAALRYFNAAGASEDGAIGEDHRPETHLIPSALQVALGQRAELTILGNDYPTQDGTCVRDYIHVDDLADAHVLAIAALDRHPSLKLNLGSGIGSSVQEVIEVCRRVTGHPIPTTLASRRAGDAPILIADSRRAREILGWQCQKSELGTIVASTWRWMQSFPHGYPAVERAEGQPQFTEVS